jgi:hypothetical protein
MNDMADSVRSFLSISEEVFELALITGGVADYQQLMNNRESGFVQLQKF